MSSADAIGLGVLATSGSRIPLHQAGLDGFGATTPAASGDLVFITTDAGQQLVLASATLQPVPAGDFTQNAANAGSVFSVGQPAISRQFVQFASDKGLFVYRFRDAAVAPMPPTAHFHRLIWPIRHRYVPGG